MKLNNEPMKLGQWSWDGEHLTCAVNGSYEYAIPVEQFKKYPAQLREKNWFNGLLQNHFSKVWEHIHKFEV